MTDKSEEAIDSKTEEGVVVAEKIQTTEPPMYRVVLLNDDYTTMEFVVMILQLVFSMGVDEAERVMLAIHKSGSCTAGTYTREVAETKVALVHHHARRNEHPLRCIMEKV